MPLRLIIALDVLQLFRFLKELFLQLGKALFGMVLVFGIGFGTVYFFEIRAKAAAEQFCRRFVPASRVLGELSELALENGASSMGTGWYKLKADKMRFSAVFTGLTPYSRHICIVETENGVVLKTMVTYLD